ncbi:MAG: DUF4199 domain-containing protein [Prevotellaceae bacterium]|jgi:hypothetical protein|nr:DUF4199 domain-containing protein [Prevotellaceae bacterium]
MSEKNDNRTKRAARGGLTLGCTLSAINLLQYLLNMRMGFLDIAVYIFGIVYFTLRCRDESNIFGYQKSLVFGIQLSIFTYIILGLYTYIYVEYIDPVGYHATFNEMLNLMKEYGLDAANNKEIAPVRNPIFITLSYIITGAFIGLIVSSITSIFTRKN